MPMNLGPCGCSSFIKILCYYVFKKNFVSFYLFFKVDLGVFIISCYFQGNSSCKFVTFLVAIFLVAKTFTFSLVLVLLETVF